MGKIRVYELAKELGVDNKIVLAKLIELGFGTKKSHSSSLESDEAEGVRRAVIRHAIGSTPDQKVVMKRVNRSTGETDTFVESRKGNLIRRRKRDEEVQVEAPAAEVEEIVASPAVEEAVEAAPLEAIEAAPEVEPEQVQQEPEVVEAAPEAVVAEVVESAAQAAVAAPAVEAVKKVGPRVLGKIELPSQRVVKPAAKKAQIVVPAAVEVEDDEDEKGKDGKGRKEREKRSRRRELTRVDLVDYEGRAPRRTPKSKAAKQKDGTGAEAEAAGPKQSKRIVRMGDAITVGELASQMSQKSGAVIAQLMAFGVMATINHAIDLETATVIAEENGFQIEKTGFDETSVLLVKNEDPGKLVARPPVVTIMGHVDHGKTSLLDYIRKASVAAKEHGGITQHIGAYRVDVPNKGSITFLDTPGHEAFTAMRARGATVTDIVVLVVAADDGVMPQTLEAYNHAKAAGVPVVVAVNKIDKPSANPDKVKQQLAEKGLNPEEWGGDTMYFNVSALTGKGVPELLEGLLLQAEVKEFKANPEGRATGTVLESRQERGRGTVATVLVRSGGLKVGDVFVCGAGFGRVRSMIDDKGSELKEAGPSTPVEINGFADIPQAGDDFIVVDSDAQAREVSQNRMEKKAQEQRLKAAGPISLEEFAKLASSTPTLELNVVVKADVDGSLGAIKEALEKLATQKVKVRVIHAAVGGVNESDVKLAMASKGIIIGFGVRGETRALADAEANGLDVRFYRVIYELIDEVKLAMAGMLAPLKKEKSLGRAEVRNTFSVPKLGTVAGCYVVDGEIKRGAFVRLLRDSRVIYEGKMASLRRFKDDVKEVATGFECGIGIEGYNDIKTGDAIEAYEMEEYAQTLE